MEDMSFEGGGIFSQLSLVEVVDGEMIDFSKGLLEDNSIFVKPSFVSQVGALSRAFGDIWASGPSLSRCE